MNINCDATVNFEFLYNLPKSVRTAVLEGSTRSTKTYSIIQYLILWCINNDNQTVRCFRQDGVTHNNTTIPDFKQIMGPQMFDIWAMGKWNATEKIYYFPNGSQFCFSACKERDGSQKLHGLRQEIAWLNEVMEIDEDAYSQISFRTKDLIIMDFNPSFNHHWVFRSILSQKHLPHVAYQHSTWEDNPFLTQGQTDDIKKLDPSNPHNVRNGTANAWKWAVYGLGQRGKVEGAIFELFDVCDKMPERMHCQRYGYGLDFGFSLDETALIDCRFFNNELWVQTVVYQKDLLVTENISHPHRANLANLMDINDVLKDDRIIADSAQPGSIEDLLVYGYNVVPVKKDAGSVIRGINLMKSFKINIFTNSIDIMTEFEHYKWGKKTNGILTGMPDQSCPDHAIDAIRYWCMHELGNGGNHLQPWLPGQKPLKVTSNIKNRQNKNKERMDKIRRPR